MAQSTSGWSLPWRQKWEPGPPIPFNSLIAGQDAGGPAACQAWGPKNSCTSSRRRALLCKEAGSVVWHTAFLLHDVRLMPSFRQTRTQPLCSKLHAFCRHIARCAPERCPSDTQLASPDPGRMARTGRRPSGVLAREPPPNAQSTQLAFACGTNPAPGTVPGECIDQRLQSGCGPWRLPFAVLEPFCPTQLCLLLGSFLLCACASFRFGDMQRIEISKLSLSQHSLRDAW